MKMRKGGYVYMLTTPNRRSLYTGVTANLFKRIWEHREKINPECYTAKYNCVVLDYYQAFNTIEDAIREEKRIKAGSRKQKGRLIEERNYEWKDLWEEIQYSY